jgi:hypothetical protein
MVNKILPEVRNIALTTSKNVKWHVIAGIALTAASAPEQAPKVLRYALQSDAGSDPQSETGRKIAREVREGILKAGQLM